MADVLLGRTDGIEGFERHVVLKRIRPEHARDQRFIRMFLDEARVAANLHHQHIVQVHDIGEADGEYFIAMEYIHGEDVRTILSMASKTRAHVPLGYAVAIVSAAAAGLHYAHERRGSDKRPLGIVHRDVSPSNILVGYDGSIKIVDFGIAKATMRQETRSGTLKGKVSYMSPEQCKSDEIDRRSDVYSLGVVLYELVTTTRLFKGENDYLVMDQIVNGRVSLPCVRRTDLPNELSTIIMRALAPDPERRYATADELRVALDQFADRAGLIASTSAIAAYMRKQFGERPEPWLELGGQVVTSLDDGRASGPPNSWTELPRSKDSVRRSGVSPRPSTPISAVIELTADPAVSQDRVPRAPVTRLPSTPPPTDSKMGWESQQPAPVPVPHGLTTAKVAMICAPLILILGVAIWRLAGTGSTSSPTAAVTTQPAAPPPPALAPVVTQIPEPVEPPSDVGSVDVAKPAVRTREPAPKRSFAPPAKKVAAAKIAAATPPSRVKPDAPVTAPVGSPPPASASALSPATPTPSAVLPAPLVPAPVAPSPVAPPPPVVPPAPPADAGPPQLAHSVVDRVASNHTRELSKCDGGEELHGEITVKFAVDPGGKVTKAQVATGIKKPKVAACILRLLQGWRFPKQGPSGALGTYTLSFQ
jgi:serine/threonine protein kinase